MRLQSSCIVFHLQVTLVANGTFFIQVVCVTLEVFADGARFGDGRLLYCTQFAELRPPEDRRNLLLVVHLQGKSENAR